MGRIVLTLDTDQFSSGAEDFEQLAEDIQAFINILHHTSPDYVEAGDILQGQLDEQVNKYREETDPRTPKEKMQTYLDSVCPISLDDEIASAGFWQRYNDLRNCIGDAMGPVSYAAFDLARYIEEQDLPAYKKEHDAGTKWVWDFVKYYEKNWEF